MDGESRIYIGSARAFAVTVYASAALYIRAGESSVESDPVYLAPVFLLKIVVIEDHIKLVIARSLLIKYWATKQSLNEIASLTSFARNDDEAFRSISSISISPQG